MFERLKKLFETVDLEDHPLYHGGYRPRKENGTLDLSNPPRGGSGVPPKRL